MKSIKLMVSAFAGLLLMSVSAVSLAHVHFDGSLPKDGASLQQAPKGVQVWFSGEVAAQWSKIKVTTASGERVDVGEVSNADDAKRLSVNLKPLVAGVYDVTLSVISGDGHRVKGSFSFTVE